MALTAFLFSWVLILALRLRGVGEVDPEAARHQTARRWILCGTLWGLIALSNSSLLSFLPACGLWSAWSAWRRNLLLTARNVVLGGTCCFVIVAPWIARNERVFHKFIPLRGNLGAELYESALAVNQGFPWGAVIDGPGDPQFKRYKQLGELEFVRQQNERAHAIIAAHPRRFAGYTVKRMYMFWFGVPHPVEPGLKGFLVEAVRELDFSFLTVASMLGLALALRNRIPGAWLFLWAFLLFPVIYYVVTVQARFRHPLEPVMTVLIVYLFQSAERRGRGAGSQALIGRRAAEG
jgi:4-amino-4-deoxy-L-arabinose transferase-like glycosyltransferase